MKARTFLIIAVFACIGYMTIDIIQYWQCKHQAPQEKVFALANEVKHESREAGIVLFGLSAAMLLGDENRLAEMVAIYAFHMKDSLESLP